MLSIHHIGCIVNDIDEALKFYKIAGCEEIGEKIFVSSQKVIVCFVKFNNGFAIELIQPTDENSPVYSLKEKGFRYYHASYITSNITQSIEELEKLDYRQINLFNSEAFGNKQCAFLISNDLQIVELIEE